MVDIKKNIKYLWVVKVYEHRIKCCKIFYVLYFNVLKLKLSIDFYNVVQ